MSRNLNPRSLFPPQAEFQPIKGVHYSDYDLRAGIPYSTAVATVSTLTSTTDGNLTVVVRNSSAGTWALAFAESPKVARVIVFVDGRDRKRIENVVKVFGKNAMISIISDRDADRQLANSKSNWMIFFNRGFPNQIQVGQAPSIVGFYPKGAPSKLPTGWEFTSTRVGIKGPTLVMGRTTRKPTISNTENDLWVRGLQRFLYTLLSRAIPDPHFLTEILKQGPMTNVWIPAFTTQSVNPTSNNETMELLGDEISGLVFTAYLRRYHPELNEAQLSNLKAYYMSEQFQPEMAKILGLDNWIRFILPPGTSQQAQDYKLIKIMEDVFESFFGGIRLVCIAMDNENGLGTATNYSVNMMNYVMSHVDIDFDRAMGSARTVFEQLFGRLKWQKPTFMTQKIGNEVMVQIRLSSSTRSRMLERGLPDPGEVLVEVSGKGEKKLINQAAEEGLAKMKQMGLMQQTSEQIRVQQEFETPEMMRLKPELDDQFEAMGYENPHFESVNTSSGVVTNLLGDLDGISLVVATGAGQNFREAKLAAIESFLEQ